MEGLFPVVSCERGGDNGHKLKHRKFHSKIKRKNYCEGSQTLDPVAQRGCGDILGDIENLFIDNPGHTALADPP